MHLMERYGDTVNSMCIEFAMYLFSFFRGNQKCVFIKFRLQCHIPFLNKFRIGPDKHNTSNLCCFK